MKTMSDSSPADLAIAFRSLPRRLREARGEVPDEMIGDHLGRIDQHVARAATLVRAHAADPDAIAAAIEAVPADGWGGELDELRTLALTIGRELRAVADANPDRDS
jgi:hypothetical protein